MEKRLLVFLLLTILWFFAWQSFFGGPGQKEEPAGGGAPAAGQQDPRRAEAPAEGGAQPVADLTAERAERFSLQRGNFHLGFSNRGAVLEELRLRGYGSRVGLSAGALEQPENWVPLVSSTGGAAAAALRWEAARDSRLGGGGEIPAGFRPGEVLWTHRFLGGPETNWAPLPESHDPSARAGVRFVARLAGVTLEKEIRVPAEADRFDLEVLLRARREGAGPELRTNFFPCTGLFTNEDSFYPDPVACRIVRDGDDFEVDGDVKASGSPVGPALFEPMGGGARLVAFGLFNKHFALLARPGEEAFSAGVVAQTGYASYAVSTAGSEERPLESDPQARERGLAAVALLRFKPDAAWDFELPFRIYAGPKDSGVFASQPEYEPFAAIIDGFDFGGWFYSIFFAGPVAHLLLSILALFGAWFGNYGIAIILLTLLVRTVLFPVSRWQQIKMSAYGEQMKRIQPELQKLRERYKEDPRTLSQKQMEVMRKHGVSVPIGGCLPVLLQMPIFIGLFAALRTTILLRHEPFVAWIHDLSRPDALLSWEPVTFLFFKVGGLNLLPLLMVVLWVTHQRMMPRPASMDPQQESMMKMMTFLPILFGFMLYNYASGLALYMITSSLIGIIEVRFIKKRWPIEEAVKRYEERMADRRRKLDELRSRVEKAQKKQRRKGYST